MTVNKVSLVLSEAQNKLKTIRDFVRFGLSLFNQHNIFCGHGTTNTYDEVVYLVLHSLNLPPDILEPYLDATVLESEAKLILEYFDKRISLRIPSPYITKQAILYDYSFYIDERAIIPRSFIPEVILDDKLLPWLHQEDSINEYRPINKILDLCTGNGSIAIIAADYFGSHVVATDIDNNALDVAKINVANYHLESQITLIKSNLWDSIPKEKFDLILTNPPYVDQKRMDQLTKEYTHEPRHALYGGIDGLNFIKSILNVANNYLTDTGILVAEIGDNRQELENIYPNLPFTWLETRDNNGFVFIVTCKQLRELFALND